MALQIALGSDLPKEDQEYAKSAFVHRYTKDHVPEWARHEGSNHSVQFASDDEWLANTQFVVNKSGRLNRNARFCYAKPTWPDNPEYRYSER